MTDRRPTRRRVVLGSGAAVLTALAGCAAGGFGGEDDPTTTTADGSAADPTTTTADPATTTAADSTASDPTTSEPTTTGDPVTPHGDTHIHGTLRLVVDGTDYHFGDEPWNAEAETGNPHFHFHTDDGEADLWHVHSNDVTLGYAVDAMPEFDLTATSVTYHGHAYREEWPGTAVQVTVNGVPVDSPRSYLLRDGDDVVVVVETDRPTPTADAGNRTG